ncbi:C45 family autoproteolytic acyltransferase/hydolase [Arthrobacter cupressi]|uniref:Isopenicillin-N N-acyltransferase like protein n=1 Tax=Arthrobacter cupressi TaxID=1045773 RepID=A0A1G8N6N3_9MICC|nr:C45 family peptidase [Arthrobacter cupressi]NYD78330.1 isopenicillin-N N-acyltransferase-like protein [Arthrobacter cupressi]SDI75848.1 isopenicillin-N N-acyltransferase like protein [Arthrobacter cupressi]
MKNPTIRTVIALDSPDPYERGKQRGAALGAELLGGLDTYFRLFRTVGLREATVRSNAERLLDVVASWSPRLAAEMSGTADGAGVETWQIAALNGRTEILSQALGARPGECSTIGRAGSHVFGVQTWDWHEELDPYWHLQSVAGPARSFVGLTEHGMLGKIGMNDAGVSVFLNILGHRDDRPAGVPVHLIAAEVLANASSVADAVDIVCSAGATTSTALTLMDESSAVTAEIGPGAAVLIQPENGTLAHTNHFLDPGLAAGEKPGLYDPDSQQRLALVQSRLALLDGRPLPDSVEEIVPFLYSGPGEPGLCCIPAPDAEFGRRWATLATITMENRKREMRVANGTPLDAQGQEWLALTPPVG